MAENNISLYSLRLAESEDFEELFKIWIDGLHSSFNIEKIDSNLREDFQFLFNARQGIYNFWVAIENDSKIIGWQCLMKYGSHPLRANIYAESSTYVHSEYRKIGIGETLLKHAINEAKKCSLEYIVGLVSVDNLSSVNIIEKLGFAIIGTVPADKLSQTAKYFVLKKVID